MYTSKIKKGKKRGNKTKSNESQSGNKNQILRKVKKHEKI